MNNFDIDSFLDQKFKNFSKPAKEEAKKPKQIQIKNNFNNKIDISVYNELQMNSLKDASNKTEDILMPLFPNETVFKNEYNSDKIFVLDKFIKGNEKRPPKKPQKVNYSKNIIKKIKKESLNYESLFPINTLWNEYITNLLNKTLNLQTISAKIVKADFHGAFMEVISSSNKNNVGLKGIVIYESKKTFNLLWKDNIIRTILKPGTIFQCNLPYADIKVTIIGDNFSQKSSQRTKTKYKNKYNLNLNLFETIGY